MLLREIQVILRDSLPELTIESKAIPGTDVHEFSNLEVLRSALSRLSMIPIFGKASAAALQTAPFLGTTVLSSANLGNFRSVFGQIRGELEKLQLFTMQQMSPPPEYYISWFCAPDSTVDGVDKQLRAIELVFDQPLKRLGYGSLNVSTVQPGSLVLELACNSENALKIVGAILAIGVALFATKRGIIDLEKSKIELQIKGEEGKAKRAEADKAESEAETARLEKEIKELELEEARLAAEERRLERETKRRALDIEDMIDNFTITEPETRTFISSAVQEMADQWEKGTRIRVQHDAAHDVLRAFPTVAWGVVGHIDDHTHLLK